MEKAYGLAKKIKGFDTYQLDNTKARLLLQRIADGQCTDRAFADFVAANKIINGQVRTKEQGYYAFRVASLYEGVWKRAVNEWLPEQKGVFVAARRGVAQRLENIDARLAEHPDVVNCQEVIKRLLAQT